jgi:hypothetical protein
MVFSRLNKKDQQKLVVQWIRNVELLVLEGPKDQQHLKFCLPMTHNKGSESIEPSFTCQSMLMDIIGKGRVFWKTCKVAAKANSLPVHGLTGKASNRRALKREPQKWSKN